MKRLFLLVVLFQPLLLDAQTVDSLYTLRKKINQTGMIVLGSWAVTNIATGSIASGNSSGNARYFHQMNAFWNIINLGIATAGLLGRERIPAERNGVIRAQRKTEKIYLINSGLDVAYVAGGYFLRKNGLKKNSDRLTGYGNSIILQGAFLLAFDGTMYALHRKNSRKTSMIIRNASLGFTGNGLVLNVGLR